LISFAKRARRQQNARESVVQLIPIRSGTLPRSLFSISSQSHPK